MKKFLFLMLMSFSLNVIGQEKPLQCDSVIQANAKTAEQIYTAAKAWVATSFNSANDVIQMDDSQNGILICKGNFKYSAPGGVMSAPMDGWVSYTLKIQVREGRYKVTMGNFEHKAKPNAGYDWSLGLITDRERAKAKGAVVARQKKTWADLKIKCKMEFMKMIVSISQATAQNSDIIDTDDDW